MDSDHEMQVEEERPAKWPTTKGKGKAKAVEHADGHDPENLPWCAPRSSAPLTQADCAWLLLG